MRVCRSRLQLFPKQRYPQSRAARPFAPTHLYTTDESRAEDTQAETEAPDEEWFSMGALCPTAAAPAPSAPYLSLPPARSVVGSRSSSCPHLPDKYKSTSPSDRLYP